MSFASLKYANAEGGIVGTRADGTEVYLDPGTELHGIALLGVLGEIAPFVAPPPPTPAELLAAERALMRCSRPQARIAMGPAMWAQVLAIAADPVTPWPLRVWIEDFTELDRMSQTTIDLAAALGLTAEQVDDLFRAAMQVSA
jgi:hypothetical protein